MQDHPDCVYYDTNRIIEGLEVLPEFSTDQNLRLLSKIKSVRYFLIANYNGISSNAIPALTEYPNLSGLGLVCCGGPKLNLEPLLPFLTNLQSLYLAQNSYNTNDAAYLAKMTNLKGYLARLHAGGEPLVLVDKSTPLRAMARHRLDSPERFWDRMLSHPPVKGAVPGEVKRLIESWLPDKKIPVKFLHRVAGLGSLGKPRYTAVGDWLGGHIVREEGAHALSVFVGGRSKAPRTDPIRADFEERGSLPGPIGVSPRHVAAATIVTGLLPDIVKQSA